MQIAPEFLDRPPKKRIKPGSGRRWGSKNKFPLDLKRAAIAAAEMYGSDGHGAGGLTGYLFFLASSYPKVFASSLLSKMLPYEISGSLQQSIISQVSIVSIPSDVFLSKEDARKLAPAPTIEPEPTAEPEPDIEQSIKHD